MVPEAAEFRNTAVVSAGFWSGPCITSALGGKWKGKGAWAEGKEKRGRRSPVSSSQPGLKDPVLKERELTQFHEKGIHPP